MSSRLTNLTASSTIQRSEPGVGRVASKAQDIPAVREAYDVDIVTDCWQDAIADPQIQVIHNCTPNALHDAINLAAIAAGKHVYAEKPMSI
ncbi:MAG: Gfo/Idh/MocA family oxidoreductase, partial [Thermoguttaceae bacterium]|nr:Gfo/Idh/MocA family oxidoreductase [Thermoguttaceae bacterium]